MCRRSGRGLAVLIPTVLALAACSPPTEPKPPRTLSTAPAPAVGAIGRLPLAFEPNTGQAPSDVRYVGRGTRYRLWLTPSGAHFAVSAVPASARAPIRLRLVGGARAPRMTAEDELPGKIHYFVGADPAGWRRNVATYRRVVYRDVYPDIDLVFHGSQRDTQFDFALAPGANPRAIGLELEGAGTVTLEDGDVVARTKDGALRLRQPVVYQESDGRRVPVAGRFTLRGRRIAFEIGDYDRARALVIDPVVTYSTYLGGAGAETGRGVGVDATGNMYAVVDGLGVVKLSADGSRLLYTTVLGDAQLVALAVDGAGHAYVAGNFAKPRSGVVGTYPVTPNALQPTFGRPCNQGDADGVMAKLGPDGSELLYSSFVGGPCHYTAAGIAVDPAGRVYVTGEGSTTTGYPATRAPFAPSGGAGSPFPAWLQVVAADFSRYAYSTLLLAGPGSPIVPSAIAVDGAGNAYLAGTAGPGFPTTPGSVQPDLASGSAPFVAKISADGSRMAYGTYFGVASTRVNALAVDAGGRAHLAGHTGAGLPVTNALQPAPAGGTDAFVARLDAAGTALGFSTYLGGGADDAAVGVGLDGTGNIYVAGPTDSTDFPQHNPLPPGFGTAASNFLAALAPAGTGLLYSTYVADGQTVVNALAVAAGGAAYLTGATSSASFPTERGLQPGFGGGASDAFLTRIDPGGGGSGGGGVLRVFITAPAADATVSGTTWLTLWVENATAGDTTFVLSEGGAPIARVTSRSHGPVSVPWLTTGGANGARTVTVAVTDQAGATGSATRTVDVQNGGGGGAPVRVVITAPRTGSTVRGTAWFTIWVEGAATGPKTYTLSQAGTAITTTTSSSAGPVSLAWPTSSAGNGPHTATVSVRDPSGRTGSASVTLSVQN